MKPRLKRQSGLITVDFLFALTLVLGFTTVLFSLGFSLTVAEIVQYIAFSSARTYAVAHETRDLQSQAAIKKYQTLISNPVFRPLFVNGWFEVDQEPEVGDVSKVLPELREAQSDIIQGSTFVGVATNFRAKMLDFRIPFYGSTSSEESAGGRGFSSFITSYLGREPTAQECRTFTADRWQRIKALDSAYGQVAGKDSAYAVQVDDGC